MAYVPGHGRKDVFSESLVGSYGRFKTDHSFRLDYLMTSVPVGQVEGLSTASEIFPIDEINFNALIQRSIDVRRVQKIANQYLEKGADRVVFFPPLLACVVLLDDSGSIKERYKTVEVVHPENAKESNLQIIWDENGFKLELPIADSTTSDRNAEFDKKKYYYYEYAASLKINPLRAKLVVLDGQHRLEAIKLLWNNPEKKHMLADLEIPICVVWAPTAIESASSSESMKKDFRELFIRVNYEAKTVSGHFITLLKDNSYTAEAIRKLADHWKGQSAPGNWNRLHLLEWNEREDNNVDQRSRPFSITTISIISRVLEEYVFKADRASVFLELEKKAEDFERIDPEFRWEKIADSTQSQEIDNLIIHQIETVLVPALNLLLRTVKPYQKLENSLSIAFDKLQEKVNENDPSFISLKRNYLGKYVYKTDEFFGKPAVDAYTEFKAWIKQDDSDRLFFYQVFQQALLRLWVRVVLELHVYKIPTLISTEALTKSLDAFVFGKGADFLRAGKRYTNRMLWRNETVNQGTSNAKNNWFTAVGATLLREDARIPFHEVLTKEYSHLQEDVDNCLRSMGLNLAQEYVATMNIEIARETEKRFEDFFEEGKVRELQLLLISNQQGDKERFKALIKEKTKSRQELALNDFANSLGVDSQELLD